MQKCYETEIYSSMNWLGEGVEDSSTNTSSAFFQCTCIYSHEFFKFQPLTILANSAPLAIHSLDSSLLVVHVVWTCRGLLKSQQAAKVILHNFANCSRVCTYVHILSDSQYGWLFFRNCPVVNVKKNPQPAYFSSLQVLLTHQAARLKMDVCRTPCLCMSGSRTSIPLLPSLYGAIH